MSDFINTIDALGDDVVMDSIIDRTITEFKDDRVTNIGEYAFYGCQSLINVDTPSVYWTGTGGGLWKNAFYDCKSLKSVRMDSLNIVTSAATNIFGNCTALTDVFLPNLTATGNNMFMHCHSLEKISFPAMQNLTSCFSYCKSFKALILPGETVATAKSANMFANCVHFTGTIENTYNPNGDKDGYIYVPAALIDSYKAATNWSTYADQFRALEDYTVDGTTTGELDESKI